MPIQPRTLSGFRDFLPPDMQARERLIDTARGVFRSFGFQPIDTPALEYFEILNGKGSEETNRQIYQFHDHGDRHVGLRFDLTVPLARYVAQHVNELPTPFKRYHIGKVWRGERPQRGRFREFMQCDFDTIGTMSSAADIEMVLVVHDLMRAIGVDAFTIRINHRQVLNGLLAKVGLVERSTEILRALDKLDKVGPQKVAAEMQESANASQQQAQQVLDFVSITGSATEVLSQMQTQIIGSAQAELGLSTLEDIVSATTAAGITEKIKLDVAIARGLDYYTGTIIETELKELPSIGSVCSGGRYDNLIGGFSKRTLPGIGASLGLDRMLAALEELRGSSATVQNRTVFIPFFDGDRLNDYLVLAGTLRSAGFAVEVYPEAKKVGQQLKYATARGFPIAIIQGQTEFDAQSCQVKDLNKRTAADVSLTEGFADLFSALREILDSQG